MSFIFNKLRLTGDNLIQSEIKFQPGLNVITGPSDTGKTFIFECINYMLGSSRLPKQINEIKGYNKIYLELLVRDNNLVILEGDLKGGSINIYDVEADLINSNTIFKTIKRKSKSGKNDSISVFLLTQNNLLNKEIKTNASEKTRKLSYRDIIRFVMIDEMRIITDKSIIRGEQVVNYTSDESTFKLILTGYDDSGIIQGVSKDEIIYSKGKVELLGELIDEEKKELVLDNYNFTENRLEIIDKESETYKENYIRLISSFNLEDLRRKNLLKNIDNLEREKNNLSEILVRTEVLQQHYISDIERLKATIEASLVLKGNHTFDKFCPLCGSLLTKSCKEDDIMQIIVACEREKNKILTLLEELTSSKILLVSKHRKAVEIGASLIEDYESINKHIENGVLVEVARIVRQIEILEIERKTIIKSVFGNCKKLVVRPTL